jgi:hypothetical protein
LYPSQSRSFLRPTRVAIASTDRVRPRSRAIRHEDQPRGCDLAYRSANGAPVASGACWAGFWRRGAWSAGAAAGRRADAVWRSAAERIADARQPLARAGGP